MKTLEEEARNWRRAEEIRVYVAAVEATVARESETIDADSELGQWIAWARHKADWIDPLVDAKCLVFDDNDDDDDDDDQDIVGQN